MQIINLFVTGQAGTGKSFLVVSIVKSLRSRGRKVVVVCASGISCSVYGDLKSCTVHSLYALGTADMPSQMVIMRAASMPHRMQEILAADTIIWDEAGMSSRHILELVNAIHNAVVERENRWKPFRGFPCARSSRHAQRVATYRLPHSVSDQALIGCCQQWVSPWGRWLSGYIPVLPSPHGVQLRRDRWKNVQADLSASCPI